MEIERFKLDDGTKMVVVKVGRARVYYNEKQYEEEQRLLKLYEKYNMELEQMMLGLKPFPDQKRSISAPQA